MKKNEINIGDSVIVKIGGKVLPLVTKEGILLEKKRVNDVDYAAVEIEVDGIKKKCFFRLEILEKLK